MNILFTCAGRRHYLLGYFKAIKNVKVVACDTSIYAPALYNAHEFFIVPEVSDKDYIDILLKEAKDRKIDAIIPLNDIELPILADYKTRFINEGIVVVISTLEVIDYCFDKLKSSSFSERLGIKSVPTFNNLENALEYLRMSPTSKFVIKPRWGTASIGVEYPQDSEELITRFNLLRRKISTTFPDIKCNSDHENCILIQKKIEGEEYGLDVVNNLNGDYIATLARRKIAMRSGETDKAETVSDENLSKLGANIGINLRHIGMLDCDVIIENKDIYIIDMNPRFGGGYPFMHFSGANVPLALVEWLKGNTVDSTIFKYQIGMSLAKTDIIISTQSKV
jgi:carbamoyl-phosphate synthase large subunit